MKTFKRTDRINELLKREIAGLLERMDFHPDGCLVSVNDVKTSEDFRHAKVLISILGNRAGTKEKVLHFLGEHRRTFQAAISKNVILKYTPVLNFVIDDSMEKGDRVLAIITELEKKEN